MHRVLVTCCLEAEVDSSMLSLEVVVSSGEPVGAWWLLQSGWTRKQCKPLSSAGGKGFFVRLFVFVFLAGREGAAWAGSVGRDQGLLHARHSQLQVAPQWTKAEPIGHIAGISVKIYLRKCRRERKGEGTKKREYENQRRGEANGRVDPWQSGYSLWPVEGLRRSRYPL